MLNALPKRQHRPKRDGCSNDAKRLTPANGSAIFAAESLAPPLRDRAVRCNRKDRRSVKQISSGMCASAGLALLLAWSLAGAQIVFPVDTPDTGTLKRFGFIEVGHDNIVVDPTIRRYTGMVAALGTPAGDGKL